MHEKAKQRKNAVRYRIGMIAVFLAALLLIAGTWYISGPSGPFHRDVPESSETAPEETRETDEETEAPTETEAPEEPARRDPIPRTDPRDYAAFSDEDFELPVGETAQLIRASDLIRRLLPAFESLSPEIATVDKSGHVTGITPGTAVILIRRPAGDHAVTVTVTNPIQEIRFDPEEVEIKKGEDGELTLVIEPEDTTDPTEAEFTSSNEQILTVDEEGKIHAVSPGRATVTAKIGEHEAVCKVRVTSPLAGIRFSFNALSVRLGDSVKIPLFYDPADTTENPEAVFTSSNASAVTVSADGTVRAVGAGSAVIRAEAGGFSAEARINVVIPVTGVAVNTAALTLNKGTSAALQASVVPANTTEDRTVSFASDEISVARVDGNGLVTAVGPGTAHITASHGDFKAVCTVTVLSPLESITVDQGNPSLINGFGLDLTVSYWPADTTDPKTVTWSSETPDVVTVDAAGHVTAVAEGTGRIVATSAGKTAVSEITVMPFIEVSEVLLSETSKLMTVRGETFTLTATVLPEDATLAGVTYSSDNPDVATVDANGVVKALGHGTAVITATAGGKNATCTVTTDFPDPDKIVVLDPGHGGKFAGAQYYGRAEEDLNLATALACKAYLESHYAGVQVYLTREANVALADTIGADLTARAQFAQDMGADILVSLHYNASNNHTASGALVFVSNSANVAVVCRDLANAILAQLATTGLQNRGPVTTASNQYFDEFGNPLDYYAINRQSANRGIPGIIVEHCFMDHDTEYIDTDEKIAHLGVLDAIGIANYLGLTPR